MFNIPELARLRKESEKVVSGTHTPLWSFLSSNEAIDGTANFKPPPINLKDKTSTSLRLLLSDAQSSLEGFSVQVTGLTKDVVLAKRQVEEAGKIVEDGQLRATEETKLLRERVWTCHCIVMTYSSVSKYLRYRTKSPGRSKTFSKELRN